MTAPRGGAPPWIRARGGVVTVEVLARPGAPRTAIIRADPRGLVVAIAAPAEKGKANEELRRFIAALAGVPRASVAIARGATSRGKVVRIATAEPSAVAEKLAAAAACV